MPVKVLIMPSAERDLRDLDATAARRVADKLRAIQSAGRVVGDVKRLSGRPPRFRLRVGDYRVLFTVGADTIRVYRVVHRPGGLRLMSKGPHILERDGKPAFAVLPIEDYRALRRRLDDLEDLALLREAEQADRDAPGRPLDDVLRDLRLAPPPRRPRPGKRR